MKRILLTGAAGHAGRHFLKYARERYQVVPLDRAAMPNEPNAVRADLTDLPALIQAAKGCDAVVHLAAIRDEADFMTEILPNNIVGVYNMYEAARRAGVRKFVFASTVQTETGYGYDKFVTPDMPAWPTTYYGAAKVLGENLGEVYSIRFNMSVICLRFGWIAIQSDPEWDGLMHQLPPWETLTGNDLNGIIEASIEVKGVPFAILPAFSRNAAKQRDLKLLKKTLGYYPQDDPQAQYRKGGFFTSRRRRRK